MRAISKYLVSVTGSIRKPDFILYDNNLLSDIITMMRTLGYQFQNTTDIDPEPIPT